MGDYTLGWSDLYNFLKTHGLTRLTDAFLTLIMMRSSKFTFSKEIKWPRLVCICGQIITWEVRNSKREKNKISGVLRDAK